MEKLNIHPWIDPGDELPPLGELVLVLKKPNGVFVAFDNICSTGGWLHSSYVGNPSKHNVMYWMRIPPLPIS